MVFIPLQILSREGMCFFEIDSVDFNKDTPDGKRTFHCTAMAKHQQSNPRDKEQELIIDNWVKVNVHLKISLIPLQASSNVLILPTSP